MLARAILKKFTGCSTNKVLILCSGFEEGDMTQFLLILIILIFIGCNFFGCTQFFDFIIVVICFFGMLV